MNRAEIEALINLHHLLCMFLFVGLIVLRFIVDFINCAPEISRSSRRFRCIHAYNQISLSIIKLFGWVFSRSPSFHNSHTHTPHRLTASFDRTDVLTEKPITNLKPNSIAATRIQMLHSCCSKFISCARWLDPFRRFFFAGKFPAVNGLAWICCWSCFSVDGIRCKSKVFCLFVQNNFINIWGTCWNWIFVINSKRHHLPKQSMCALRAQGSFNARLAK